MRWYFGYNVVLCGSVVEWFKVLVLKISDGKLFVSLNFIVFVRKFVEFCLFVE